jgi:uncharacterized protein GlcG (DUF336 family)
MTTRFPIRRAALAAALAVAPPISAWADEPPMLWSARQLTVEAARQVADAALAECRRLGALVAVSVVDRAGVPLAMLRDPLAGMHTPDTAQRKAWTAVSFRNGTTELMQATRPDSPNGGIRHLPQVAMLGGGLVVEAAGSIVGGVGVSGAPGGDLDDACARKGIDAIADRLEFE